MPGLHGQPEPKGEEPWRALFEGRSSREILADLVDGDPLEISPRCAERLLTRCYLLDMERLYFRSVARVAYAGPSYRGAPEFTEFLRERIDASIDELLREDRAEERAGHPVLPGQDARYTFVSQVLGMEVGVTRRGVCHFNVLDERIRHAFFSLVVQAKRFRRYVAEGNGPPERVSDSLRIAFETLGAPYPKWLQHGDEP
ncbi:MAG: hypothetical protein JNL28_07425 [Planctomycetes bacterium]|nr:hypothetical protein [Planctomycetota bacterium]